MNILKPSTAETEVKVEKKQPAVIDNEKDYAAVIGDLIHYCKNNKLYYQQLIFGRIIRWQNLELPANTNNKILIELRKEAITELDGLQTVDDPITLLQSSEALFMEPGGQFCLDLQYYTCIALERLGDDDAKEQLELLVNQLVKQHPKLSELKYKDSRAFANNNTKQWLLSLGKNKSPEPIISHNSSEFNNHQYYLEQSKLQSADKKLATQLKILKTMPVNCAREEIEKDFAIAKLLSEKQTDLSCYQYQTLLERVKKQHLEIWLPELASQILSSYLNLLKISKANDEELSRITKWLCRLDPLACL
jgi:type VI secretion system protein VasJ